jgi:isoquinoline 1-oxidoreductase beta subunit
MNIEEISLGRGMVAEPSRRGFLEGIGATAFLAAFQLLAGPGRAGEASVVSGQFNAFLAIGEDDIVTAIIAQTEGGQGNSTGMTQVIAAELGAAWPKMRYRFTTERRPEYINPMLYEGLVLTAGSTSIPGFYDAMRHAAAATREMLVAAAAKQLGVSPDDLSVSESKVTHSPSGRSLTFGQLAAAAAKEQVPAKPRLRARNELLLIGQPLDRLDVPHKVDGSARFGLDLEAPNMLYAAVRHGPAYGSTVAEIDDAKAKTMPGVRLIMAVPQGVAVVADQYWQAVKALAEVRETYASHPNDHASSTTVEAALRQGLEQPGVPTMGSHGDVAVAMKSAVKVLEAEFSMPFLSHACMEPVSCTASVVGDKVELWLSTKSPQPGCGPRGARARHRPIDHRCAQRVSGRRLRPALRHGAYDRGGAAGEDSRAARESRVDPRGGPPRRPASHRVPGTRPHGARRRRDARCLRSENRLRRPVAAAVPMVPREEEAT